MPVVITPESPLGLELAKWNKPYTYQPFPRMMYRASRRPDGVVSVNEGDDGLFGGRPGAAEQWSQKNWVIVNNDDERVARLEQGWREHPTEAIALFEARECGKANEAAHRAWVDRNMSPAAQAEVAAAEAATEEHLPEIKERRRQRRKRS